MKSNKFIPYRSSYNLTRLENNLISNCRYINHVFLTSPPPSLFCRLGEVSDLFLTIFVNAEESRLQSLSSLVLSKIFLDGGIDAAGNEMLNTVNRTFLNCLTGKRLFVTLCVCVCVCQMFMAAGTACGDCTDFWRCFCKHLKIELWLHVEHFCFIRLFLRHSVSFT